MRQTPCARRWQRLLAGLWLTALGGCVQGDERSGPEGLLGSRPLAAAYAPERVAFGSCFSPWQPDLGIWSTIAATEPDLFLFLGDNVYARRETDDPALPGLRAAYAELAQNEGFAALRAATPVLPVWDDHDYGFNDAGASYAARESSEALFEDVWDVSPADPRRARDGIYFARTLGPPGRRLQLIMLDTRFFRSPLAPTPERGKPGMERYVPDPAPVKTLLGGAQWDWLERKLREPAQLRLLVSSIQVLADGHGWEAWRMLPRERERLFALLAETGADNTLILSGDRHSGSFYQRDDLLSGPLVEVTASSLNKPLPARLHPKVLAEAGPHRLGAPVVAANFGLLQIDWPNRSLALSLRDADGAVLRELILPFPG